MARLTREMAAMAVPAGRGRDPEARRARIRRAAAAVFAANGYAAGSVREICERAGVNVASVNYYFGSKEGLYREVLLASHRQVLAEEPPPEPGQDPERALHDWVQFCLRFVLLRRSADPVLGRIMAHEMRQPTPVLSELVRLIIRPVFGRLREIVARLAGTEGEEARCEMAAHQIVAMCVHFDHSRAVIGRLGFTVPSTEAGIAELGESIVAMALHGLRGSAPGRERKRLIRRNS
jgi:AcrR family transcriptional regulator